MHPVTLAIVGSQYPNKRGPARRFGLSLCVPGEPIELRLEPNNPADEHAIAVYSCQGVQLGYVPSQRAVMLGLLIRRGHEPRAIFQGLTATGGWIRVAFDCEEPVLPAPIEKADDDPVFWPDEEWPD